MTIARATPLARRRAFTLLELIVAVGAVALIAVGIAAVFESVSRTVSGGKRVSRLNQFAALVERQMREDFKNMTRDGVLVIRHQYAFDAEPIPLHSEDASPRPRRTDEILFMKRGDFTSARSPTLPGVTASGSEAIIHYGYGTRLNPLEDYPGKSIGPSDPRYDRPHIADGRQPNRDYREGLELGSDADFDNPNRYAADWTLLRRVTLLVPPTSSNPNIPPASDTEYWDPLGIDRDDALDNEIQIGGQPAAASAFRSLAKHYFNGEFDTVRRAAQDPASWAPLVSSGIVDVATSDLAEIRRVIMDAGEYSWNIGDANFGDARAQFDPTSATYLLDNQYNANLNLTDLNNNLLHMHSWMEDLFPTDTSMSGGNIPQRPRYEPQVPDFVGMMETYGDDGSTTGRTREAYRMADQRVLSSAIFSAHCSEFIVEYSFGRRNTDDTSPAFGELVWHGLERDLALDGENIPAVRPYPFYVDPTDSGETPLNYPFFQTYTRLDGTTTQRELSGALVYGVQAWGAPGVERLVAHFGYTDPAYQPPGANDPETIPWQWPTLLRVTVTLADPADPSNEETFQFVFETPDGRVF